MLQELEPITPHQRLGAKSHLLSRCAEHSSRYFQKAEMGPELESVPANIQPMGPHGDRSLCYTTEHKMLLLLSQNPRLRCTNIPMEILSGLSLSSPTKANFSRTSLRNVDSNKWPCKSWIPPLLYLSLPYHHWQCRIFSSRAWFSIWWSDSLGTEQKLLNSSYVYNNESQEAIQQINIWGGMGDIHGHVKMKELWVSNDRCEKENIKRTELEHLHNARCISEISQLILDG